MSTDSISRVDTRTDKKAFQRYKNNKYFAPDYGPTQAELDYYEKVKRTKNNQGLVYSQSESTLPQ